MIEFVAPPASAIATRPGTDLIRVDHLTKDYGRGRGLFDVTFQVKRGEVMGIVGTNGAGKTTTMRHLMGFLKPDSGTARIGALDARLDAAELKRHIGYVPGEIDFPDVGTGTSFLRLQAAMAGLDHLDYMNQLIDRFKIDITAPLRRMSKGMKQKMGIVAGLMAKPQILLLDEPSTGLDPLMRDTLVEAIEEAKAGGATVLMSSHVFKELEDTCDTVLFLQAGRVVSAASRSMFEANPREMFAIRFADDADYRRFIAEPHRVVGPDRTVGADPVTHTVTAYLPEGRINEFFSDLQGYRVASIQNPRFTLEQFFTKVLSPQVLGDTTTPAAAPGPRQSAKAAA
ncbi:MAG: ATP-binding cassette domain-containing protein [Bifidobacteriaceae bacterium]|jgi:ABC-2 type transport system ATP-binding protein|nr:ATP-binding cassette domain-containing protein [Bifidobacteriaceae bacterium]